MPPSPTRHPRQGRGRASMRECRRLLAVAARTRAASRSTARTVIDRGDSPRQGSDPRGGLLP